MNINERLGFVDGSYYLNESFRDDKSFSAGKIGANELLVLYNYLVYRQQDKEVEWNSNILYNIYTAGFFPSDEKAVEGFVGYLFECLGDIDCYALWSMNDIQFEYNVIKHHNKKSVLVELMSLEPYYSGCPWTEHLKDKKVLVISSFPETIKEQYKNRKNLWNDSRILPDFELITLEHQMAPFLNNGRTKYNNWIEMVDDLKEQIEGIDFDVALIGTGTSSLPLTAHVKKMGKKGIHLGGALQILFGIKGGRWNDGMIGKYFYNDSWVNPKVEEIPVDYKKVENGCYY